MQPIKKLLWSLPVLKCRDYGQALSILEEGAIVGKALNDLIVPNAYGTSRKVRCRLSSTASRYNIAVPGGTSLSDEGCIFVESTER